MKEKHHYATVTDAVNNLKQQGYTIDFNLKENSFTEKFNIEDFEIVDVYRYEGNTDPADEAAVYALESKSGLKGILVTGYGIYADAASTRILEKLHHRGE
jgi:hypothetical protein